MSRTEERALNSLAQLFGFYSDETVNGTDSARQLIAMATSSLAEVAAELDRTERERNQLSLVLQAGLTASIG